MLFSRSLGHLFVLLQLHNWSFSCYRQKGTLDCNLLLQKKGRLGCTQDSLLMKCYEFQIFEKRFGELTRSK